MDLASAGRLHSGNAGPAGALKRHRKNRTGSNPCKHNHLTSIPSLPNCKLYHTGPDFHSGPHSGDRAPNVLFLDEKGVPRSLVDYFYGTQHTLFLFAGRSDRRPSSTLHQIQGLIAQRCADVINCYIVTTTPLPPSEWAGQVIVNTNGAIHQRYRANAEAIYLIRPDQHIGYRGQPVSPDLFAAYVAETLYA